MRTIFINDLIFKRPELSFKIEKEYFQLNFEGQEPDYTLKDDFYERTVAVPDLTSNFDDATDSKFSKAKYYGISVRLQSKIQH